MQRMAPEVAIAQGAMIEPVVQNMETRALRQLQCYLRVVVLRLVP